MSFLAVIMLGQDRIAAAKKKLGLKYQKYLSPNRGIRYSAHQFSPNRRSMSSVTSAMLILPSALTSAQVVHASLSSPDSR